MMFPLIQHHPASLSFRTSRLHTFQPLGSRCVLLCPHQRLPRRGSWNWSAAPDVAPCGGFPSMGVPQNGCFIRETPIKMDDLGVPLFQETCMGECQRNMFVSFLERKRRGRNHQINQHKVLYHSWLIMVGLGGCYILQKNTWFLLREFTWHITQTGASLPSDQWIWFA